MNLQHPDRGRAGFAWLDNVLDWMFGEINVTWGIEHKEDGTHGAVTVGSIAVSGDAAVTGNVSVSGLVGPLNFGTAESTIVLDGLQHGPDTREDRSSYPSVNVTADGTTPLLRVTSGFAPRTDNNRDLGYRSNGTAHRRFRSGYFGSYAEAPVLHATTAIYERGRDTSVGEWITPAFAAGNYTASGTMTWTLTAGDVLTVKYMLVGKTLTFAFALDSTTVGGTVSTELRIAIPAALVSTGYAYNPVRIDDNGVRGTGIAYVVPSGTTVVIERMDGANYTLATNNTRVLGELTFEVN